MRVNNMRELQKAAQPILKKMINQMQDEVMVVLEQNIMHYYNGFTPQWYNRTMKFLASAIRIKPQCVNGQCVGAVCMNTNFIYKSGMPADVIMEWANEGLHGGLDVGDDSKFWDDTMRVLVMEKILIRTAKECLRKAGFTVEVS